MSMMESRQNPRFGLGRLVATPNALQTVEPSEIDSALLRHIRGDWGDVDSFDRQVNEDALEDGGRLFSVYHTKHGAKFWVITEADRSATTILLPEDY